MTKEKFRAKFDKMEKFSYTLNPEPNARDFMNFYNFVPIIPCSAHSQEHFEWSISKNTRKNLGGNPLPKNAKIKIRYQYLNF